MAPDFQSHLVLVYRPLPRCLFYFFSPYTLSPSPNIHTDFFQYYYAIVQASKIIQHQKLQLIIQEMLQALLVWLHCGAEEQSMTCTIVTVP